MLNRGAGVIRYSPLTFLIFSRTSRSIPFQAVGRVLSIRWGATICIAEGIAVQADSAFYRRLVALCDRRFVTRQNPMSQDLTQFSEWLRNNLKALDYNGTGGGSWQGNTKIRQRSRTSEGKRAKKPVRGKAISLIQIAPAADCSADLQKGRNQVQSSSLSDLAAERLLKIF